MLEHHIAPAITHPSAVIRSRTHVLPQLINLRWIAIFCLSAAVLSAKLLLDAKIPYLPLIGSIALTTLSNLGLSSLSNKRSQMPSEGHQLIGASLLIDITSLSIILACSGGPANPFSVFYLILVMLAAIMTNVKCI